MPAIPAAILNGSAMVSDADRMSNRQPDWKKQRASRRRL